jgi:hypothetical protein
VVASRLGGSAAGATSSTAATSSSATTAASSSAGAGAANSSANCRATGAAGTSGTGGPAAASCDSRCAPDFPRLLQLEGLLADPTEIGRGVDNRLEQDRIRKSARALSTAQDLVARRGEFVNPGECELPVGHFPTAI